METKEWALILYTILAQMAVGSFVTLGVVHFIASRKAGEEQASRLSDRALLAIGPVLVLALLSSFFHLGNPINAPRAITNLASSWLSREVFLTVSFFILGGAFALLQWRKLAAPALRTALAWAASLVGLGLVYAMARLYMLDTQPAWNNFATPVLFFSTALLLGVLAVGAALVANYTYLKRTDPGCVAVQCSLLREAVRTIAVSGVALLGVELVVIPLQLSSLAAEPAGVGVGSIALLFADFGMLFAMRLALAFLGAGIVGVFAYRAATDPGQERLMGNLIYAAFALVLVSEVMGRFLFYATHLKIGL